jgi:glycosyltransferase involved in cell wall biosynthesis
MIILEDQPDGAQGGSELSLLDLALRSPHKVKLFYRVAGNLLPRYEAGGCDVFHVDIKNYRLTESLKYLLHQASPKDQLIYVNHYQNLVFGALKKQMDGAKLFYHVRLPPPDKFGTQLRLALRFVDHFIAVSNFTRDQWVKRLSSKKFTTIYNGVSLTEFCPGSERYEHPTIFFAGRNVPYKGLETLLAAFQLLPSDYRLVVLGKFNRESTEQIRYLGPVSRQDIPKILAKCHLAVVPSEWPEPCSRILLEAMACNVPTIGSAVGGTPEVVIDTSHLFTPKCPQELAQTILAKINSPLNYRQYIEENFNVEQQANKVFELVYS